jgi:excisionase family DNA binding protein
MLDNKSQYLSITQAAERVGIGVEKMRKLIKDGDVPVIRWGYRTLRIDSSKLDEVIADLTIGGSNR